MSFIEEHDPDYEFVRPYSFEGDASEIEIKLYCTNVEVDEYEAEEIAEEIAQQALYWNDYDCHYWFYDFRLECGLWASGLEFEDGGSIWHVEVHD